MKYICILSAVALAALSLSACSTLKEGTHNVTVVSINDIHGRWFSEPFVEGASPKGSLMADQSLIGKLRSGAKGSVLLIDAGDELSGGEANFYCTWADSLSEHIFTKLASYMDVDAFIPGPDDISSPAYPRVKKGLEKAGISVIESGRYKILRKDGIKIAIAADTTAAEVAGKRKPDLIIAKASAKALPRDTGDMDLVLAAHDHRNWANDKRGYAAIDAGSYGRNIGIADIEITKSGQNTTKNIKISAPTVSVKDVDEEMKSAFSSEFEAVKDFVNSKIGTLDTDLVSRDAYCGSSDYMNLYHALTLAQPGIDISLCATLSVDGTIKAGDILFRDIVKTLYPFDNKLVVIRMSGKEVKDYLEASYDNWIMTMDSDTSHIFRLRQMKDSKTGEVKTNFAKSPANFDSAGGLSYTVDVTKPYRERVRIISMADGKAFDDGKEYAVGITNYRASGAGGMLTAAGIDPQNLDKRTIANGQEFRVLMYKYIIENGGLKKEDFCNPSVVGTWMFIPEEQTRKAVENDFKEIFPTR